MSALHWTITGGTRPLLVLRDVGHSYGSRAVFSGVTLTLGTGGLLRLSGPNGCGKTTLARIVLGLLQPTGGTVTRVAPVRLAAVFQDSRLVPHLDAVDNLRMVAGRGAGVRDRIERELAAVGLESGLWQLPASQLSGGQQRRVAIARALVANADLLVLDEPWSGIDAESKPILMAYVQQHWERRATVLITHEAGPAGP